MLATGCDRGWGCGRTITTTTADPPLIVEIYGCNDVLEAELLALREGISLAIQWSMLPLDIESYCLQAVQMIVGGSSNKSKYVFIVKEIISTMEERSSCITHSR